MRDPVQKVITRQGVAIDLDQAGESVVECGIGVSGRPDSTAHNPVVAF
jgi:hypothetical protein